MISIVPGVSRECQGPLARDEERHGRELALRQEGPFSGFDGAASWISTNSEGVNLHHNREVSLVASVLLPDAFSVVKDLGQPIVTSRK